MWIFTQDFIKLGHKGGQTEVVWVNLIVSKSDASVEFSMSIFALCTSAFQSGERTYFFQVESLWS